MNELELSLTHMESGCICFLEETLLVEYLRVYDIPDETLMNTCCWGSLCRAYELNYMYISEQRWERYRRRHKQLMPNSHAG
jgi:hypothetical protein